MGTERVDRLEMLIAALLMQLLKQTRVSDALEHRIHLSTTNRHNHQSLYQFVMLLLLSEVHLLPFVKGKPKGKGKVQHLL